MKQKIIILEQGQNCTLQKQGPGSILTSLTLPPNQAEERKGEFQEQVKMSQVPVIFAEACSFLLPYGLVPGVELSLLILAENTFIN